MIRIKGFPREIKKLIAIANVPKRDARVAVNSQIADVEFGETTTEVPVQNARPYEEIPGPRNFPIVGNTFRFIPYIGEYADLQMLDVLRVLRDAYGDIVKLDGILGRRPAVFLYDPNSCAKMYRMQGVWPSRIAMESLHEYRLSRPEIYEDQFGLSTSQGKVWHDFRSKVNPYMMQPRVVKPHVAQINEVTEDFINKMRDLRDSKTLELPANFNNELNKWSLEAISSIALNHRLGCLEHNLDKNSEPQTVISCVHDMFEMLYRLEILPSLWKIYKTPDLKRLFRSLDRLNGIAIKYINRAKEHFDANPTKNTNEQSILEKLLQVDGLTARVMSLDMFTAGVDTTGNTSAALLYYIADNQDKQQKLRDEAMTLLPDKDTPVTADILNEAPYLKACIKEGLRMFPISIGSQRTLQTDIVLDGYKIPKGSDVIACHAIMSMDPQHFPNPEKFIPERWLRDNTEFPSGRDAHPFAYMPFGFGARTCVGRRFAEMEMETLALKAVRNFRIEWHHEPLRCSSRFINIVASEMKLKIIDL